MAAGIRQPATLGTGHYRTGYPGSHLNLLPERIPGHRQPVERSGRKALDASGTDPATCGRRIRPDKDLGQVSARETAPPGPALESNPAGRRTAKLLSHQRTELHLSFHLGRRDSQPVAAGPTDQGRNGKHPAKPPGWLRNTYQL